MANFIHKISNVNLLSLKNVIAFTALCFFCLISLLNHYYFRTFAYDLGIYNNSVYQYSHFINNPHPIANGTLSNFLGDHFALYTIIISPLYYLFGNYTTLICQILAIIFGGFGIYKFVKQICPLAYVAELSMLQFYFFYGFQSALSFDYHDNVLAAALLPWFFYYIKIQHIKKMCLLAFIIIIGKENMALWLFFICIGLLLLKENRIKKQQIALVCICILSLLYFFVIVNYVIPSFSSTNNFSHFKFDVITKNNTLTFTSIKNLFLALFIDISNPENYSAMKLETYTCILLAGGFALIINYQYLIMLIPIFMQKMYHNDISKWGISSQYSVEFAAIIVISLVIFCVKFFKSNNWKYTIITLFTISTLAVTFTKMVKRESVFYDTSNGNIFCKEHYQSRFDRTLFLQASSLIPNNAKLCALENFVPHLANRKFIYSYPKTNDADYLFIAATPYSYSVSGGSINTEIDTLRKSKAWQLVFDKQGYLLFKKKN